MIALAGMVPHRILSAVPAWLAGGAGLTHPRQRPITHGVRGEAVSRSVPSTMTPLRLAAIGAAVLLVALATVTQADSDLWGHLRFGLDTLATHRLPFEDPYSFTQDRPWINHEWLSELTMGVAYAIGGTAGLAVLKGLFVAGALSIAWLAMSRVRPDARIVLMAALALGTVPVTRTLRPQLWTLLSLALLCTTLLAADRRWRRWLPLLFIFWANSHGGWIVGFGIFALWTLFDIVEARKIQAEPIGVLVASGLATLITPYGWTLWTFLASTVSLSGRAITEWQPLWNAPPADSMPWVAAVAIILVLATQPVANRGQILGVLAALAYASLKIVRIVPLFVLCTGVLMSAAFARRWPRPERRSVPAAKGEWPLAIGLVIASIVGAGWLLSSSLRCVAVEGEWIADAAAVRRLKSAPSGRVVTFFNWGQYAIWHLSPDLRVSMDGRRETVYSDARLDEHGAILDGRPEGLAVLDHWSPEYVWLPSTSTTTKAWLVSRGYRLEHDSEKSFIAVRPDRPVLVAAPQDSHAFACFPG